MRILVTNNDGIESPGIKALAAALFADGHEVTVFAPTTDRSGAGAAIGKLHGEAPPAVVRADRRNAARVLNMNVPNLPIDEVKGVREATLAAHGEVWIAAADVSGGDLKIEFQGRGEAARGTDVALIRDGYVAVTPLVGIARARPHGAEGAAAAIKAERGGRILAEQLATRTQRSDERSVRPLDSVSPASDTRRSAMT